MQGVFLEFTSTNGEIYITPKGAPEAQQQAVLIMADIPTCAGLVHTVSQVLVPEGEEVERIGELDDKDQGTGKPVRVTTSHVTFMECECANSFKVSF